MRNGTSFINGVNGTTGQYLAPPWISGKIQDYSSDSILDPATLRERRWWVERHGIDDPDRAPVQDVDPCDLSSSGWGVVFGPDVSHDVRDELRPLLKLRREQASQLHEHYYREYHFQPGQSAARFLRTKGAGSGPANPEKVPYYLLLVGDPRNLPFRFQYELDVQYAVGRLYFDDPADYGKYARKVEAAEKGLVRRPRKVGFFGVSNDPSTTLAAEDLVQPLAKAISEGRSGWEQGLHIGDQARKADLARLLDGENTPALLFTSSHGLAYQLGDPRQLSNQGSLLCQDWPGPPDEPGPIDPAHYFSAADLDQGVDLTGLITFHFACYSAGTPEMEEFVDRSTGIPQTIAPHPFLASLAKRLLSSGALAVMGHIERAWTYSFNDSEYPGHRIEVFESTLKRLLDGHPVGSAMEYVNQRYAELSVRLNNLLTDLEELRNPSQRELTEVQFANNDARNYVVLGDPAVRLQTPSTLHGH